MKGRWWGRLIDNKGQVECYNGSRHRQDCDNIDPDRTRPALKFKPRYSWAVLLNGFTGRARLHCRLLIGYGNGIMKRLLGTLAR
jgi:hypothetical protein